MVEVRKEWLEWKIKEQKMILREAEAMKKDAEQNLAELIFEYETSFYGKDKESEEKPK